MAILGMSLVLASYYLAYTTVWEYHYATVFSMVPVLLILSRTGMLQVHPVSQALFLAALLFLYLPTPCVFFRHKVAYVFEWITLCRSFRVLPVLVLYGVLFVETLRFILQRLALQTGETN
jgi:hypothetical protein